MYYPLLTDEGLERMDELPFDVPEDLPRAVDGEPVECFRVLSPASGLPIVGLAARDPGNVPITARFGDGIGIARRVSGTLAMFGLDGDGTYRDMTNAEMACFTLDQVDKRSTPVLRMGSQAVPPV